MVVKCVKKCVKSLLCQISNRPGSQWVVVFHVTVIVTKRAETHSNSVCMSLTCSAWK